MKTRKTLFLIALLSITVFVSGQSIDIDSEWRVNSSVWEPGYQIDYRYYKNYIDGDTVINSKVYHKVYQSGYGYIDWVPTPYYYYIKPSLHGFLREENNKWYTFHNGPQEELLYDFNLQVNDTIESAFAMEPIIITAIDSVLIDSEYKKRFHLNDSFGAEYIIEGIGATTGLFEYMGFFESESELICYAKNGTSFWGESTEECNLTVSISDCEKNDLDFHIYPNPAKSYINIITPSINKTTDLTLVNITGAIVVREKLQSGITNTISLNKLPSGIYFAIIENELNRQTKKLIVE